MHIWEGTMNSNRSFETIDTYISECFRDNLIDIILLSPTSDLKTSGKL